MKVLNIFNKIIIINTKLLNKMKALNVEIMEILVKYFSILNYLMLKY